MSDTQTIEVDQAVVDAVAKQATDAVKSSITVPTADEIAEKLAEKMEKTQKKDISDVKEADSQTTQKRNLKNGLETLPKEARFAKGLFSYVKRDAQGMAEYAQYVNKAWAEKANYQNVGTDADGGSLVPDPEFIAEVERLTDDYGVASRLANVRRTDRDSVTLLSGTNEVSFTKVNEATAANAAKLTYADETAALEKYIATLIMTSELVEDAAINIFADATTEIARARAKLFDQLVFTDATHGLLSAAVGESYKTQTVGSAITDFDADDAMNARYKVASSARGNGRYFMHPTVWNNLRQRKNAVTTSGSLNYLFGGPGLSVTPMIDGVPVELVDVMPEYGTIAANKAFAVFGDLGRVMIHVKRLLETKVFDSGVVKDAGGSDFNLITQDSWALRATMRAVPQTRFDGAFCILGTGTVS